MYPYLGDDLQPGIDLDICEPTGHSVINLVVCSILEPQGQ